MDIKVVVYNSNIKEIGTVTFSFKKHRFNKLLKEHLDYLSFSLESIFNEIVYVDIEEEKHPLEFDTETSCILKFINHKRNAMIKTIGNILEKEKEEEDED